MSEFNAIVLCDFDGTIVEEDVFDNVLYAFGESPYGVTGTAFDEGKISHRTMNEGFVKSLRCSPTNLETFVIENTHIRKGFAEFYSTLTEHNIDFAVISGGWDIYIQPILKGYSPFFAGNLQDIVDSVASNQSLTVVCNSVTHDGTSYAYKSHALETERCAPDKSLVVAYLRSQFNVPILCIGDSKTDFDMASSSDFVFATGILGEYCKDKNIPFLEFSDFHEIRHRIVEVIDNLPPISMATRRNIYRANNIDNTP